MLNLFKTDQEVEIPNSQEVDTWKNEFEYGACEFLLHSPLPRTLLPRTLLPLTLQSLLPRTLLSLTLLPRTLLPLIPHSPLPRTLLPLTLHSLLSVPYIMLCRQAMEIYGFTLGTALGGKQFHIIMMLLLRERGVLLLGCQVDGKLQLAPVGHILDAGTFCFAG